jgi:hypothetical protein
MAKATVIQVPFAQVAEGGLCSVAKSHKGVSCKRVGDAAQLVGGGGHYDLKPEDLVWVESTPELIGFAVAAVIQPAEEYEPFGPEWRKELTKWGKAQLAETWGISGDGITKAQQIALIREKLIAEKAKTNLGDCSQPSAEVQKGGKDGNI